MNRALDELTVRLPRGFRAGDDESAREATMRRAKVRDELRALEDFRVFLEPEKLRDVLLARVLKVGGRRVTVEQVGALSEGDLDALEKAYRELNGGGQDGAE